MITNLLTGLGKFGNTERGGWRRSLDTPIDFDIVNKPEFKYNVDIHNIPNYKEDVTKQVQYSINEYFNRRNRTIKNKYTVDMKFVGATSEPLNGKFNTLDTYFIIDHYHCTVKVQFSYYAGNRHTGNRYKHPRDDYSKIERECIEMDDDILYFDLDKSIHMDKILRTKEYQCKLSDLDDPGAYIPIENMYNELVEELIKHRSEYRDFSDSDFELHVKTPIMTRKNQRCFRSVSFELMCYPVNEDGDENCKIIAQLY